MISAPIKQAINNGLFAAIPESSLTVSQWAARYRVVSMERVADPGLAGSWQNERTPYLVEIMDAVTDPGINEIVFLKSSQVGGTECINNMIGYFIHIDPATILYICENEGKANAWSVESFAPMLRDTPVLAEIMGIARQRDSTNRIESKAFRGGHFALGWASSPATLSSRPRRIIFTDETDAFEPTKEGDPVGLAEARTKTAGAQRKIVHVSTPRDEETATLLPLYEESTREKFFVPCPECEEFQFLTWRDEKTGLRNVRWETDKPETAAYYCKACAAAWDESDKEWMLTNGAWCSTNPEYFGNRRGFWINELYSPFSTWSDMAKAYIESKNHPEKLKVFINTRLAEYWKLGGEKIDYADLKLKGEDYAAEVPDGVLVLTAGVDIQDDRLEAEVVGWGLENENWSIDYRVFRGDPAQNDVWEDLKDFLTREFIDSDGNVVKVRAACIDTGGHHTQDAYKFCKTNARRNFWAIKGANTPGKPIFSPPTKNNSLRVNLYTLGTEAAKDKIFAGLKLTEEGPGYSHFPANDTYNEDYFKMLCAEKRIEKFVGGKKKSFWVKVSANARNEALDCRVYALAAVNILNPDWKSFQKRRSERRALKRSKTDSIDPRKNKPSSDAIIQGGNKKPSFLPKKSFIQGKRSGFVKNW